MNYIENFKTKRKNIELIIEDKINFIEYCDKSKKEKIFSKMRAVASVFKKNISQIVCDIANQYDEFYVYDNDKNIVIEIEVVTESDALFNDIDFLSDKKEIQIYREKGGVGSEMSFYKKLGETEYYFRLL